MPNLRDLVLVVPLSASILAGCGKPSVECKYIIDIIYQHLTTAQGAVVVLEMVPKQSTEVMNCAAREINHSTNYGVVYFPKTELWVAVPKDRLSDLENIDEELRKRFPVK